MLTQRLPLQALEEWQAWATQRVRAFQRTSSAVEGRNGYLSQMHHNHRGLPPQRPRYGRRCITSMVALQMARRQPPAFSVGGFQISLRPSYPIWRFCHDRGNENALVVLRG